MEREAVLQWLQGVHTATHDLEEFDEGFINPDKPDHSSFKDSSARQYTKQTSNCPHPDPSPFEPSSSSPSPSSPIPSASSRRAAFKVTKSNTLCCSVPPGMRMKQPHRAAPSLDMTNCDWKVQSSISPLPSSNPDFVLPTIQLTESELIGPERKPLIQQSSTSLLSKLQVQQYQLLQSSKFLQRRSTTMGNQSNLPSIGTNFSMSQIGMGPVSDSIIQPASQVSHKDHEVVNMEPMVWTFESGESGKSDNADSAVGSCIADRGELSDMMSSGDMEEEWEGGEELSSSQPTDTGDIAGVAAIGVADFKEERDGLKESDGLEGDEVKNREGNEISTATEHGCPVVKPDQLKLNQKVCASDEQGFSATKKAIPVLQQEMMLAEPSFLSSILSQPPSLRTAGEAVYPAKKSAKSNPLRRSSSADISDFLSSHGTSPLTPSVPRQDSLAFHDHHLGRVPRHGLVKSPTLDEGSSRRSIGPTRGSKLHGHSPLLERRRTAAWDSMLSDYSCHGEKWTSNTVGVAWLSKPATESLQ